jgi:hypothetical protein
MEMVALLALAVGKIQLNHDVCDERANTNRETVIGMMEPSRRTMGGVEELMQPSRVEFQLSVRSSRAFHALGADVSYAETAYAADAD